MVGATQGVGRNQENEIGFLGTEGGKLLGQWQEHVPLIFDFRVWSLISAPSLKTW